MQSVVVGRIIALLTLVFTATTLCAQTHGGGAETPEKRYKVEGGVLKEVNPAKPADTVKKVVIIPDSIAKTSTPGDSSLLSKREQKRLKHELEDSTFVRHSKIFRDSIPISRMCAISMVAPGFSQLYNQQYWKIPVLYSLLGSTVYFGIKQNQKYSGVKKEYDNLVAHKATREQIDPVQTKLIQYNTRRQLLFVGAIATYIYFIGDGAINYKGYTSPVKKATTLSTICPGAGQFYNKSFWKVPIVMGGFATMAYIIDFNNRGYKRFQTAYNLLTDGDESTIDEFNGSQPKENLQRFRNNYRRNRDLCIILTGALYLLNIVDAHVDAHLKDYDISDDLAGITLEPSMNTFYSMRSGTSNMPGFSLKIKF